LRWNFPTCHVSTFFFDAIVDFSVVYSTRSKSLYQMANMHGAATEPVDGDEDDAPDAHRTENSRKDPVQLRDLMMLLLANTSINMENFPRCWQSQQDKSAA
jgi:hypothetical protein